ncbi:MAG: HAD family phosphatase [Anaerolineaceae bacterium]|jgi:2-haloacid dehalogenase|nr:HAD family phosphatase [Anaerolineaceae bacterium]
MKKTIVFDFGAVLIDWNPYYLYRKLLPNDEAIKSFLEEIDFAHINPRIDAGMPLTDWVAEYSQKYPHRRNLIAAYHERFPESVGDCVQGTVDILYELKSKGYPLYGLSNWSDETFARIKDRFGFIDELDGYLLSGMVGQIKPGEEIFHSFLARFDKTAEDCIFIDDNPANIATAERVGFTGILFQSPDALRVELKTLGILGTNGHQP